MDNQPEKPNNKKKKPPGVRLLAVLSTLALLTCLLFTWIFEATLMAWAIICLSIAGLAGPSVASGEGLLEILGGIVEMLIEGIMVVVEMITGLFSGG